MSEGRLSCLRQGYHDRRKVIMYDTVIMSEGRLSCLRHGYHGRGKVIMSETGLLCQREDYHV